MGGSVQLPGAGNNRKTGDFYLWKTSSGDNPVGRTVRASQDTPIIRNIQVTVRIMNDVCRWEVRESRRARAIKIRPSRRAGSLVVGD